MGLARRNFENRGREKAVRILQCFSLEIVKVKTKVAKRAPEVKSVDGDCIFLDGTMKQ